MPPPAPSKLIFFDDFNTGHLDRSKWNVEITGGHYNDELQAYVDSAKTLYEENGLLVIQPQYTPGFVTKDGQKFDFISARINTKDKFDFKYGKAEARIRLDSGETPFVNRYYFPSNDDVRQWHTYAVDWAPDSLSFSYDGHTMFRLTRAMANHYGPWAFDKKQFLLLNFALGGAYPAKINGVTKPYYGMPQSTLDLIKRHKARMLVDWVRVTQYP